jgi:hypothetical protein
VHPCASKLHSGSCLPLRLHGLTYDPPISSYVHDGAVPVHDRGAIEHRGSSLTCRTERDVQMQDICIPHLMVTPVQEWLHAFLEAECALLEAGCACTSGDSVEAVIVACAVDVIVWICALSLQLHSVTLRTEDSVLSLRKHSSSQAGGCRSIAMGNRRRKSSVSDSMQYKVRRGLNREENGCH